MKIYDWHIAPNLRRMHIYLAEKGPQCPARRSRRRGPKTEAGPHRQVPHALVPMLELDDGTCIGEAMAICRYFEEIYPEPPLMGVEARDKAIVEMWEKRANEERMLAASELFRNTAPTFAGRGLPGSADPIPQLPQLVERAKARLGRFYGKFDQQLAANEFVAGPRYTIADITTLCAIDFGKWTDLDIPAECKKLRRWYDAVSARPSAKV